MDVPLIVTEEAASHVAKRGLQQELEQNLAWVRRNVADLDGIRVELFAARGGRMLVVINTHHLPSEGLQYPRLLWDWVAWRMQTLSPEVGSEFLLSPYHPPLTKAA